MSAEEINTNEVQPLRFATREEWLVAAIDVMRAWFVAIGAELPRAIRVSVGFTIGTASENAQTRGVTSSRAAGTDGTNHVFISPELGEAFEVLRTLAHELVHVSDDCESGHRGRSRPGRRRWGWSGG